MPTKLDPTEEATFQKWIKGTKWHKEFKQNYGEDPNLDDPQYDYRKVYKKRKADPEFLKNPTQPDPYDVDPKTKKPREHWSSEGKSADHPTAWKEEFMQQTGKNPDALGITKEVWQKSKNLKVKKP